MVLKFLSSGLSGTSPDFQSHYTNLTSGEMALATLASAISQDTIILMTIAHWVLKFLSSGL